MRAQARRAGRTEERAEGCAPLVSMTVQSSPPSPGVSPAGATSTARSSESYRLKDRGKAGLTTLPATRQGRGVNFGPSLTPEERTPRHALPSGESDGFGRAFTVAVAAADSRVGKMGLLPAGGVVGIEQCAT